MSKKIKFPTLSNKKRRRILQPPSTTNKPLRVVFDTDFDNEVDDHFALAWLLEQEKFPIESLNKVKLEAVLIEPYSFKTRLTSLVEAYVIYLLPPAKRTKKQQAFLDDYQVRIEDILALGTTPFEMKNNPHLNGGCIDGICDLGIPGSYGSVLKMFDLMGVSSEGKVFTGATHFMQGPTTPVKSPAAERLIELALTASPEEPIYVVAIACPTNVSSALLLEPRILPNIVVIWDAGYPTNSKLVNNSLNLDEDLYASQLLFSSGVPLVYIPGFYIAEMLNMSKPDVETWFGDSGEIGQALIERYNNNPLYTFYGIDKNDVFGRSWVIWDIANVGWLLNPSAVPTHLVKTPILTDKKTWKRKPKAKLMREAYGLSVNSIFVPFAKQLLAHYGHGS
ncbi:MAG: hypothetical protein JKX81_03405 [Arenicella sp.]|nr:hypothetical protein [Arenicella sp.]